MPEIIVVFGSSRTKETKHLSAAEELGKLLAEAGFTVGSGGYGGVMNAVSKGAYQAGGHVIAYTTKLFGDLPPNKWFHEERRAEDLQTRIGDMLRDGTGFVATWGGIGTLAEVTMAWNIAQIDVMQGSKHKPLILMGDHWKSLVESIGKNTEIGKSVLNLPIVVSTPKEAVDILKDILRSSLRR